MNDTPDTNAVIPCPECRKPARVYDRRRAVVELDGAAMDGMTEGQAIDYEMEVAAGGGDNWTALVETAKCEPCGVVLERQTLDGVEQTSVFHLAVPPKRRAGTKSKRTTSKKTAKRKTAKRNAGATRKPRKTAAATGSRSAPRKSAKSTKSKARAARAARRRA